jgi:hypothetical protein
MKRDREQADSPTRKRTEDILKELGIVPTNAAQKPSVTLYLGLSDGSNDEISPGTLTGNSDQPQKPPQKPFSLPELSKRSLPESLDEPFGTDELHLGDFIPESLEGYESPKTPDNNPELPPPATP